MTRKQNVARIADRCKTILSKSRGVKVLVEYTDKGGGRGQKVRSATYDVPGHAFGYKTVSFTYSPDIDTPHIVQDGMRLAAQRKADTLRTSPPAFVGVDVARGPSTSAMYIGIPKHMIPDSSKTSATEVKERINELSRIMSTPNEILNYMRSHEASMTATVDLSPKSMITKLNEMTFGQLAEEYRKARASRPKDIQGLAALIYEDTSIAEKRRRCDIVMAFADDIAGAKFGIRFAAARP